MPRIEILFDKEFSNKTLRKVRDALRERIIQKKSETNMVL